ncbi:MAG: hypothetical protein NTU99_13970, partial [Pseudanabaena sp. LacPavin_0818_WC45_MAG_42_6]|nr:hypothetical protein [Pseudanabaena sp. LacPavin_0818_WC45_MAG_42_6]
KKWLRHFLIWYYQSLLKNDSSPINTKTPNGYAIWCFGINCRVIHQKNPKRITEIIVTFTTH